MVFSVPFYEQFLFSRQVPGATEKGKKISPSHSLTMKTNAAVSIDTY